MNPTTDAPPPQQPHRLSTSCDRHSDDTFTGFCPSCLFERLTILDHSNASSSSSSSSNPPKQPIPATSSASVKPILKPSSSSSSAVAAAFLLPELRRTKSFSASKNEGLGFSGVFEPQRKSCDGRLRNSLWNLFTIDDDDRNPYEIEAAESRNLASFSDSRPSFHEPIFEGGTEINEVNVEISEVPIVAIVSEIEDKTGEIIEEEEIKTMKDHIDIDSQVKKSSARDFKDFAGSFWSAASVFSKKFQKWRQKQKRSNGRVRLPVEKPIERQFRETQSEVADYGFGRRSCDTDPRFSIDIGRMSLDAGRISFDGPRHSFDEPRASWDGYMMGRTVPRMPTMVSVVEDGPALGLNHVLRSDTQIPVEELATLSILNSMSEADGGVPGGSAQTRDYYTDSSSTRRKSLDRSNSIRKTAASVVVEIDQLKSVSSYATANSKVTPATSDNFYIHGHGGHGSNIVFPSDRDLRISYSNSLRDDCSETFEIPIRDDASTIGNGEKNRTDNNNKSKKWSKAWNIWGFIQRRNVSRANGNVVERLFSESWQGSRRGSNPKLWRSNSGVSWRNLSNFGGSLKKNGLETNGLGRKKRDEFVLERNRSARYSPNNIEKGLLRFYLTPMRGSRRGGSGKIRSNHHPPSVARSILRLY